MPTLNKVLLIGNLTRAVELRFTPKGTAVANGGIAVNEKWTGEDGQKHEEVCFVDFTVWAKAAETFAQFTGKGSTILLEGKLKMETWEKDDEKRSKLVLTVESFQFLDKAPEQKEPNDNPGRNIQSPAPRRDRKPMA